MKIWAYFLYLHCAKKTPGRPCVPPPCSCGGLEEDPGLKTSQRTNSDTNQIHGGAQENAPQDHHPRLQTLNAKLHRALSKLAHIEADRAAAEQACIEQGRSDMGHLMRLGDNREGEAATSGGQKMARPAKEEGAEVEADRATGLPSHRRTAVLEQEEGEA
jgi:hypothetical protein